MKILEPLFVNVIRHLAEYDFVFMMNGGYALNIMSTADIPVI